MIHILCAFFVFIFIVESAQSEVLQWKDKEGQIHFGENSSGNTNSGAETVKIYDKYHIPNVTIETPLKYTKQEPHRPISFTAITLSLPHSETENVRIGRIICGAPIDLYWVKGIVDFQQPDEIKESIEKFSELGYTVKNGLGSSASPANLSLTAEIMDLKINMCPSKEKQDVSQNASYIKIKWKLSDTLSGKALYMGESSGSHDALSVPAIKKGTEVSVSVALAVATNNLLADPAFSASLVPVNMQTLAKTFDATLPVAIHYGSGLGSFKAQVDVLKKYSVIIKTKSGFGSGVILNSKGYVLTNAHVVGEDTKFEVIINGVNNSAELVRIEPIRDVALIKITDNFSDYDGVTIAHTEPSVGDGIFVIGTPLSLENSQTTTKGIISAVREMQGLKYFQTDASVNHGSSGGPAFNENG